MTRRRLDTELVRRGLTSSQAEARAAVHAGLVTVGGALAEKAASLVADDEPVHLSAAPRPFVSRGGEKLDAALGRFEVDPAGRDCLDVGASTGGFTDRLLRGGAARVAAVDVGYGQLSWSLRIDPRVIVAERTNARDLTPETIPFLADLVVADLSFISLRTVLPALVGVSAPAAEFIVLVKPQFEARPQEVGKGGVVRDPAVWMRVVSQVSSALTDLGVEPQGAMASPLRGPAGNVEFFVHARRQSRPTPIDLEHMIAEAGSTA